MIQKSRVFIPFPCHVQHHRSRTRSHGNDSPSLSHTKFRVSQCQKITLLAFATGSFPLQHHHQAHDAQHDSLEPRVFAQHDSHIANKWDIGDDAADDVLALDVVLAPGVEFRVVCGVVVAFRQELRVFSVKTTISAIRKAQPTLRKNCHRLP